MWAEINTFREIPKTKKHSKKRGSFFINLPLFFIHKKLNTLVAKLIVK